MAQKKKIAKKTQEKRDAAAKPKAATPKQERKQAGAAGEKVVGILVAKVNESLIDQYVKDLELSVRGGKLGDKIRALQKHQRETTPKTKLSTPCSVCCGVSNLDLPACPYCGDANLISPGEEPPAPGSMPAPGGDVLATQADGSQVIAAGGVAELEHAEQQIRLARESGVASYWDLSYWLLDVYKGHRWKHRIDAEGKQVFRSWTEYARLTHDLSGKTAIEILEVADNFSREDFLLVGVDRLRQIMRYSGDERTTLLEAVKNKSMTRAKLREYIAEHPPEWKQAAAEASGEQRQFRGGAAASQKGSEALRQKAKKRKEEALKAVKDEAQVTAIALQGRHKIGLYHKKDGKKRAQTFAHEPVGKMTLPNGVVLHFQLVRDSAGLALVMNVKKEDKAADSEAAA